MERGVVPKTQLPEVPKITVTPVFEVGDKVLAVASFDGQPHLAEVIEKKASTNDEAEYYVHYSERTDRTGLLLLSAMFHNV
eukprot:1186040-Prorocentrum_minimum.AAC.3